MLQARKSARAVKAPEVLTYERADGGKARVNKMSNKVDDGDEGDNDGQGENDAGEDEEEEEEDDDDDDDDDDDHLFERAGRKAQAKKQQQQKLQKQQKQQKQPPPKAKQPARGGAAKENYATGTFYDNVRTAKSISNVVEAWVADYKVITSQHRACPGLSLLTHRPAPLPLPLPPY